MNKIVIIVVVLAVILGVLYWKFGYLLQPKKVTQVTIKLWGLWDDDSLIRPAIDAYRKLHSNVRIEYTHQNLQNYRTRVQTQITDAKGPDIFLIHNSWLPMFFKDNSLASMPANIMTIDQFQNAFYPVAENTLTNNGKIFGMPFGIDGLVLFYNEDLIKQAGVSIPKDWKQFQDTAFALTKKDDKGNILISGAALGAPSNVDYWSDIIGLLYFQQPSANILQPSLDRGPEVLSFFTGFITDPTRKTWSQSMESSTKAFSEGKLAFYFAPSRVAQDLKVANPNLNFKTAPVPQLPKADTGKYAAWASFWAFAVSSNSPNKLQAWDFLNFLTSAEIETLINKEALKIKIADEPYSRVDLKQEIANDPIIGSVVNQGDYYKSWYLSFGTLDQGINDDMISVFEEAINTYLKGDNSARSLHSIDGRVTQVLNKYGIKAKP